MAEISGLNGKTLVMLVGPTSIGKSTLMNAVVALDARFSRVRSFTTRPPRANDESGHYFYLTEQDRMAKAASGAVITDVIYPTTGHHYGTLPESYGSAFNLLDTLANSVNVYRELPFSRTITVSLTADPDAWERWLDTRYPTHGPERTKRLQEAVLSMEWSLAQAEHHAWLVNAEDDFTTPSKRLITLATNPASSDNSMRVPPEATKLLERAKTLLSYE